MKQMENLLNSLLIFVTALLSFWDFFSSVAFFLDLPGFKHTFFLLLPLLPVHCKQQRGKCSRSQPGPSVSGPHHRYLSVGF